MNCRLGGALLQKTSGDFRENLISCLPPYISPLSFVQRRNLIWDGQFYNRVHLEKQVLYTNGITLSALIKICKEGEGGRETKLQETKKGMKMLNIIYETVENKSVCHF